MCESHLLSTAGKSPQMLLKYLLVTSRFELPTVAVDLNKGNSINSIFEEYADPPKNLIQVHPRQLLSHAKRQKQRHPRKTGQSPRT